MNLSLVCGHGKHADHQEPGKTAGKVAEWSHTPRGLYLAGLRDKNFTWKGRGLSRPAGRREQDLSRAGVST